MLVLIDRQRLYDIADAMRQRFNVDDHWLSSEMADAIRSFATVARPQDVSATFSDEMDESSSARVAAIGFAAEPTSTYVPSRSYVTTATRG